MIKYFSMNYPDKELTISKLDFCDKISVSVVQLHSLYKNIIIIIIIITNLFSVDSQTAVSLKKVI